MNEDDEIIWSDGFSQAAYGAWDAHLDKLSPSPQRSNHSEHMIVRSTPMTPYTH
jgi:hypothetical protein